MADWILWRDTLCLPTAGANKIQRPTKTKFRKYSSLGMRSLSLTATLRLQSNGWQFAVLTVVGPTLTTLVMTSTPCD